MAVVGVGGIFLKAADPVKLAKWYETYLGVNNTNNNYEPWIQQQGPTIFSMFAKDTEYFGNSSQSLMLNFRVEDLDGMLRIFESDGVKIVKQIEDQVGVGKFASIEDPEGNRIELWEVA